METPVEPKQSSLNSELHSRTGVKSPIDPVTVSAEAPAPHISPGGMMLALMKVAKDRAAEVERWKNARDECERQFQHKVQDVIALTAEVERLRRCLAKQPNTYMIAYQDGDHERLVRYGSDMELKNDHLTAEVERLRAALIEAEPTDEQVDDACLSYAHDYGLMSREDREKLSWQAKWWLHAWRKTLVRTALKEPRT